MEEEQKKLKNALDTLKHLNLGIPAEYTKKLDDYPEQIKKLEKEIEQERLFLNYLQSRVLPLLIHRLSAIKYQQMPETKFIVDRMLGRLTAWLRLLGYDTASANEQRLKKGEDDLLLAIAKKEKRVIVSRNRELAGGAKERGIPAILIYTDDVVGQLKEMHSHFNLNLEVEMIRCTMCNSLIRTVRAEEMEVVRAKDYVFPDLFERNTEFWICDNCQRVYWEGSHWNNIQKTLEELKKQVRKGEHRI